MINQTEIQEKMQMEDRKPDPVKPSIPLLIKEMEILLSHDSISKAPSDSKPSTNGTVLEQAISNSSQSKLPIKRGTIDKPISKRPNDKQTSESKNSPQTPTIRRRKT